MKVANRRFIFIVLAVAAILAVVARLAWSPALLWFAKHEAAEKYAHMQDATALNTVLSSQVKSISPGNSGGQRVSAELDGYQFSLPSPQYTRLAGTYTDFGSDKLKIRCLGVGPLTGQFAKAGAGNAYVGEYFAKTDPYQILVDSFNSRPTDIPKQETFNDLEKCLKLLLIKAVLMPIGSDKLWERIDTGKRQGIVAGVRTIFVTLYLPESKEFADVVIFRTDGAQMDDVYRAIGELNIQPISTR